MRNLPTPTPPTIISFQSYFVPSRSTQHSQLHLPLPIYERASFALLRYLALRACWKSRKIVVEWRMHSCGREGK